MAVRCENDHYNQEILHAIQVLLCAIKRIVSFGRQRCVNDCRYYLNIRNSVQVFDGCQLLAVPDFMFVRRTIAGYRFSTFYN